jgi:diguanylate cyclase (GGDEF)-like protein
MVIMSLRSTGHGHKASGLAGSRLLPLLWPVLAALLMPMTAAARADCLNLPFADVRSLETLSFQDPKRALEGVRKALAAAQSATPVDNRHVAALYALQAESYSLLELDADARTAAEAGLKLVSEPTDPIRITLLTAQAENVYDSKGIDGALTSIEEARSFQARPSAADVCLQITLGRLQYRKGQVDLSLLTLTQAYQNSVSMHLPQARVEAAAALSPVMRVEGDFPQALALNQEVIDWQVRHQAQIGLSVTRYLRGQILTEMRDYTGAIDETERARKLSVELDDEQGVGFADLALCEARQELGQLAAARESCENALRIFTTSKSTDVIRQSQTELARLDLTEGHASKALASLNDILVNDGTDIQPRRLPGVYLLRAQANVALHKYADAYRDLSEYQKRHVAAVDEERTKQVAALRARFETDREIARNELLQHELALAQERSERQRIQLRWVVVAISASGVVIALLTYLLVTNLRYRKQLVRLASIDSLTGLPNRGRTAALATMALEEATATSQPLSLALIDLDRFKVLNDQLGHATGDRVLKEFATLATTCLRPGDTLGRWGGEEFLLALPNTPLDKAMKFVDAMRERVADIKLPRADLRVSISAGIATTDSGASSLDEVLVRADVALYKAKNSGRDLVCYADESFQAASTGVRRALRQQ